MAKVTVQVLGGASQVIENVSTLGEAKRRVNAEKHTATINGEPAGDDVSLEDYAFITLAPAVKGA